MSEDTKSSAPAPEQTSELKNLKAEMERKLANQNEALAQVLNELKKMAPTPAAPAVTKRPSVYEDEEGFVKSIEQEVEKKIEARLSSQQTQQQKVNNVIQSILKEYPEASDDSSALMQRAKELHASFSDEDRASPLSLRTAVVEAAAELGVKPRSKRGSDANEGFTLSGGGSRSSGSSRERSADLDSRTEAFAQIMGLDTSKKEVRERLKKRGSRDFTRYGD